jgi:hypothetical protein
MSSGSSPVRPAASVARSLRLHPRWVIALPRRRATPPPPGGPRRRSRSPRPPHPRPVRRPALSCLLWREFGSSRRISHASRELLQPSIAARCAAEPPATRRRRSSAVGSRQLERVTSRRCVTQRLSAVHQPRGHAKSPAVPPRTPRAASGWLRPRLARGHIIDTRVRPARRARPLQ